MRKGDTCPVFSRACLIPYLEELKEHMVEMRWHIHNVDGLARVFGCEAFHNMDHKRKNVNALKLPQIFKHWGLAESPLLAIP